MQPSANNSERTAIRWFFGMAFGVAIIYIGWAWHSRRQECIASCEAQGVHGGHLAFNTGSRLNNGVSCVCDK